jgi:hypothetical protein
METESTFGIYELLAILGALAWLPQLITFITRQLTKPKLTIITDTDIEIGYTTLGPIFNIQIVFLAESKRVLIRTVEIELTHSNNETQRFTWDWFEETLHTVDIPQSGLIPTKKNQKAIAINVDPDSLVEKKIGFQQNTFKDEQRRLVQLTTEEFLNIYNAGDDRNQIRARNTFNNLREYYKNGFNWKIGDYKAKITAKLSDGQSFETEVEFQLTSLDLKTIELNIEIAQKLVDKEYGAEVEIDNNWLWVNTKKIK